MQETETDVLEAPQGLAGAESRPSLLVVHHRQAAYIGLRKPLKDGFELPLGRGSRALPGVFDSTKLSRQHARLSAHPQGFSLVDEGSRNGTFVGGRRLEAGARQVLTKGDVVRLGDVFVTVCDLPLARPRAVEGFSGVSAQSDDVRASVAQVAGTDIPVVLIGETGVGKEVVATAIHHASGRTGALVDVNCAAVDDQLVASDLFGHHRGAFTGAERARDGLIRKAAAGTLFLDELTDATPRLQSALLKVVDTGVFRPMGADTPQNADVRWLTAVQPRIHEALEAGTFRPDLWARLARWTIAIPPLRERRMDVPAIARALVTRLIGTDVGLSPVLVERLMGYDWPLNVRELEAVLQQATVTQAGAEVLELDRSLDERLGCKNAGSRSPGTTDAWASRTVKKRPDAGALRALLDRHNGSVRAAAAELSVDRKTLYRWLKATGVDPNDARG